MASGKMDSPQISTPIQIGGGDYKRTELGESLYRLKYADIPKAEKKSELQKIANAINYFLFNVWKTKDNRQIIDDIDYILPAPTNREDHPLLKLTREIVDVLKNERIYYIIDYFLKNSNEQVKNQKASEKQVNISLNPNPSGYTVRRNSNVLLFDDLYQSGTTLKEMAKIARKDPNINKIYVLTITKTRKND